MITSKKEGRITLQLLVLALFVTACLSCSNEGDEPAEPTAQELAFEKIVGTWSIGPVGGIMVDGQDVSVNYPNFTLTVADGRYNSTNGGSLFSATGTWEWLSVDAIDRIVLEDGKTLSIDVLSETSLGFSFIYVNPSGGVAAGVSGNYQVTLVK